MGGAVSFKEQLIIIIMYIYHVLINALSAHMLHMNLNMIFYTHGEKAELTENVAFVNLCCTKEFQREAGDILSRKVYSTL